jgi:hypothetical protein
VSAAAGVSHSTLLEVFPQSLTCTAQPPDSVLVAPPSPYVVAFRCETLPPRDLCGRSLDNLFRRIETRLTLMWSVGGITPSKCTVSHDGPGLGICTRTCIHSAAEWSVDFEFPGLRKGCRTIRTVNYIFVEHQQGARVLIIVWSIEVVRRWNFSRLDRVVAAATSSGITINPVRIFLFTLPIGLAHYQM